MSTSMVTDTYIYNILKRVYKPGVTNNKPQQSPTLKHIKREAWDAVGESLQYATNYGDGGNGAASYDSIVSNPSNIATQNAQWSMKQGHLARFFNINQPEILATETEEGAFMSALENKLSSAYSGLASDLSVYLFGGSYGVIQMFKEGITIDGTTLSSGTQSVTIAGSTVTISDLPMSATVALNPGVKFQIASAGAANTAVPGSALIGNGAYFEVTSKTRDSITATVTNTSGSTLTVYVGDYIEKFGSRVGGAYAANATAIGPEGFPDLIPSIANRSISDTRWTSYIATNFRDVDRSVAVEELAGQFVLGASTGNQKDMNAITELLGYVTAYGGGASNTKTVINNVKFMEIGEELGYNATQWLALNSGANKNRYTNGVSELASAFGEAFTDVEMDLRCPYDKAYMFQSDDLALYDIGNVGQVIDTVGNEQLGKYDVKAVGDGGIGDNPTSALNLRKMFGITPNAGRDDYSDLSRITVHFYGNFMLERTSGSGVVQFQ